jgi:propanol-preferring alcohol dehydrogenase
MRLARAGGAETGLLVPVDLSAPVPGPGEALLRVAACGVCRTDLHIVDGEVAARLPIVPGHQAAGIIEAVSPGVSGLAPGMAAGLGWLSSWDGTCRHCLSGSENLCRAATFTGRDRDGGFAELVAAPAAAFFALPREMPPERAAPLLCAGIIGYRTLRLCGASGGGRIGLFGFGASAHLAIQVARHWGCEVFVFTREERHRRLARDMGAVWAGGSDENPGVALSSAALFAPAGELVRTALARLDRGGVLAVNAIHMSDIPSIPYAMLYGERVVRSVQNYTRRDGEEFLALAHEIPVTARVTTFPLEDANEALARIRRGEVEGAAVLQIAPSLALRR